MTIKRHDWERPRSNYVKLNVDEPFDPDLLKGSYGAVIRDSNGRFVATGNGEIDWCGDALMAEAPVLRFGLNLATKVACNCTEVSSDNIEMIETMKNGGRSFDPSVTVFDDIYHLACDFPHIIYIFERASRETNCATHDLVKLLGIRCARGAWKIYP
uniref:Uncharacterized protein n=1 Tax=Aegilops tauschii TaxID=37682 RepID=M8ASY0_AEGTA